MEWTVLCVSKISPAQITRNMILERAGYQIIAIDDPNEAVRIFKTSAVDAVVFGDSISGDQRSQSAQTFKSLKRSVPIIALSKTSASQFTRGLIDQHLESLGDPRLLLEALQRLLSRDRDGSAQAAPAQDNDWTSKDARGSMNADSSTDGHGSSATTSGPKAPKNSAV